MARKTFTQSLGTGGRHPFTLRDGKGATITTYTAANPLSSVLWQGDDLRSVATPLVEWAKDPDGNSLAPAGKGQVVVTPDDTAGLDPGLYHLQGFVGEADGTPSEIFHVFLRLTATAGAGVPAKVYGTADDLALYYPAIDKLQAESDEAGFLEQRADARRKIDRRVEEYWPGADKTAIRASLAADRLVVTPLVREMAAKYALALVLGSQLPDTATVQAGRQSAYQAEGRTFLADAQALADRWIAELDEDGDGTIDSRVDCRTPDYLDAIRPRTLVAGRLRGRSSARLGRGEV